MTIEEVIVQLKDLRKDREGFLANDEPDSEFAKDIEAIDMAVKALAENAELKRLLRLAIEDINRFARCVDFRDCKDCCMAFTLYSCKWKHAEEALEMISNEQS